METQAGKRGSLEKAKPFQVAIVLGASVVFLLLFLFYYLLPALLPPDHPLIASAGPSEPLPARLEVRTAAEFEPSEGVFIRYPSGIPYELIAEISEDAAVVTIVSNQYDEEKAKADFAAANVRMENVKFIIAPTDTYWVRDYTPFFLFTENGQELADFKYNRPRPNDDRFPSVYADEEELILRNFFLVNTGGNLISDGHGLGISTTLLLEENPGFSGSEINETFSEFLGIPNHHIVPDANGEYVKHIGCWAKLLAPDVLMIREVPPEDPQYDELEAAADYFSGQNTSYGTPLRVVRIYTPSDESYTNALILNSKVFVPLEGTEWDDEAISLFQAEMPGYEIIGVKEPAEYPWSSTDSLFCRVREIPDRGMLYIWSPPPQEESAGYAISAEIIPYSGAELTEASVFYRAGEGEWQRLPLSEIGAYDYSAILPPQPSGTTIEYYINAEDSSGRSENNPYVGAAGPRKFIWN